MNSTAQSVTTRSLAGGGMSLREADLRLQEIENSLAQAKAAGEAMVQEFKALFPNAPGYLVRFSDRSLTEYRWRRSSAKRWRGEGVKAGVNMGMSLLSGDGLLMLEWLPAETRLVWLDYEQRRLDINHDIAQFTYARRRLKDWLERTRKIADLRRAAKASIEAIRIK